MYVFDFGIFKGVNRSQRPKSWFYLILLSSFHTLLVALAQNLLLHLEYLCFVILPADKGRVTVVMDKTDYYDKMDTLVNDKQTYEELKRDPTQRLVGTL